MGLEILVQKASKQNKKITAASRLGSLSEVLENYIFVCFILIDSTYSTSGEAWWLNGSMPYCCPAVPGSNPESP
jgi:hypothetical protein